MDHRHGACSRQLAAVLRLAQVVRLHLILNHIIIKGSGRKTPWQCLTILQKSVLNTLVVGDFLNEHLIIDRNIIGCFHHELSKNYKETIRGSEPNLRLLRGPVRNDLLSSSPEINFAHRTPPPPPGSSIENMAGCCATGNTDAKYR